MCTITHNFYKYLHYVIFIFRTQLGTGNWENPKRIHILFQILFCRLCIRQHVYRQLHDSFLLRNTSHARDHTLQQFIWFHFILLRLNWLLKKCAAVAASSGTMLCLLAAKSLCPATMCVCSPEAWIFYWMWYRLMDYIWLYAFFRLNNENGNNNNKNETKLIAAVCHRLWMDADESKNE